MAEANRRAQRVYHDPITYSLEEIGGQSVYDDLMVQVADWFAHWRNTPEPGADARLRIKCCMDGVTLDGKPWFSHWNSTFATRMKMLTRFDVLKMQPIKSASQKQQVRKQKLQEKKLEERRKADPYVPQLTAKEGGKIHYGDAQFPVTEAERKLWERFRDGYLEQFPELKSINASAELAMLCDLHLVHERNRLNLLAGKPNPTSMNDTTAAMLALKKGLGIHPDQLAKRISKETGATIAEAVLKMESFDKARELRERFWIEELLVVWQMYSMPSPRPEDNGWQIDEVGLMGMSKCRTCQCAKCGHPNYVGLSIPEITEYLQRKGALTPIDEHIGAARA